MKNRTFPYLKVIILLACIFCFESCIIQNPKPDECEVIDITVSRIGEGGVHDIVFYTKDEDFYYINRGLEQGLNLDSLNAKVLNKSVTLHLAKVLGGRTTNHISQMVHATDTIFTEFR